VRIETGHFDSLEGYLAIPKDLKCEECGCSDLLNRDGFLVCSGCGLVFERAYYGRPEWLFKKHRYGRRVVLKKDQALNMNLTDQERQVLEKVRGRRY
jgi:transcription initiation factor TFIIIB Brf1 subunit/transcription initiation factor TFIIB